MLKCRRSNEETGRSLTGDRPLFLALKIILADHITLIIQPDQTINCVQCSTAAKNSLLVSR